MRGKRKTAWSCLATAAAAAALISCSAVGPASAQTPLIGASSASAQPAATGSGCAGTDERLLPVSGDIRNPSRTDGGFYYYTIFPTGHGAAMCVGRVREWVYYPGSSTTTTTKTWRVTIDGEHVDSLNVSGSGGSWHYWDFQINSEFPIGLVCVGASSTPGYSCKAP